MCGSTVSPFPRYIAAGNRPADVPAVVEAPPVFTTTRHTIWGTPCGVACACHLHKKSVHAVTQSTLRYKTCIVRFVTIISIKVVDLHSHSRLSSQFTSIQQLSFLTVNMGIASKLDEKTGTDHVEHVDSQRSSIDDLDTIENTKTGKFAWLVSITAAIGGMLFGYDTGIIRSVRQDEESLAPAPQLTHPQRRLSIHRNVP